MFTGEDRPGRRWGGKPMPSQVIAHVTQNCGADVADRMERKELHVSELADAIGVTDKQIRRIVSRAKQKLADNPDAYRAFIETCRR